jgi:hypothetical protein
MSGIQEVLEVADARIRELSREISQLADRTVRSIVLKPGPGADDAPVTIWGAPSDASPL